MSQPYTIGRCTDLQFVANAFNGFQAASCVSFLVLFNKKKLVKIKPKP